MSARHERPARVAGRGRRLQRGSTTRTGLSASHATSDRPARGPCCGGLRGSGTITDIGDLGGPYGRATAVNNSGQITGQANVASGNMHAFLWLPAPAYGLSAGMHDLDPNLGQAYASGINSKGQIVGWAGAGAPWLWLPQPEYGLPAGTLYLNMDNIPNAVGAWPGGDQRRRGGDRPGWAARRAQRPLLYRVSRVYLEERRRAQRLEGPAAAEPAMVAGGRQRVWRVLQQRPPRAPSSPLTACLRITRICSTARGYSACCVAT